MIKTLLILIVAVLQTACAPMMTQVANYYNWNDPCQESAAWGRPQNYQAPNWCGASNGGMVITDRNFYPQGYIRANK